ncbi:MAG: methyltransferase domain-containing protein [Thermoleophilia bacterium]
MDHFQAKDGETARDVFGRRVERYAALDVFSDEKYYRPLLEMARPASGERVLDVAAGTGLLASLMARDAAEVVGTDVTPEMLSLARDRIRKTGQTNVSFIEADAAAPPFDKGFFDLVTCRTAFHHFPEPVKVLGEIYSVLREAGRFVMEDVYGPDDDALRATRESFERLVDPSHVLAYRPSELEAMLSAAGFSVELERKPSARDFSLDLILRLDRVEDPEDRAAIVAILDSNLDTDLGGFSASRVDGELVLRWRTIIIAAVKN